MSFLEFVRTEAVMFTNDGNIITMNLLSRQFTIFVINSAPGIIVLAKERHFICKQIRFTRYTNNQIYQ